MTLVEFVEAMTRLLPVNSIIQNPGGGTSTIVAYGDDAVSYRRGKSKITVCISELYTAYLEFRGRQMSSTELRERWPEIFDSAARPAGHNCNCTFLFRVLERLGLSGPVAGAGQRGNPFSVSVLT
jgi:hypothetical protein